MRGSSLSTDGLGKPILAMASTTKGGVSKIVPNLTTGEVAFVHFLLAALAQTVNVVVLSSSYWVFLDFDGGDKILRTVDRMRLQRS
jgi:hypothetical protein